MGFLIAFGGAAFVAPVIGVAAKLSSVYLKRNGFLSMIFLECSLCPYFLGVVKSFFMLRNIMYDDFKFDYRVLVYGGVTIILVILSCISGCFYKRKYGLEEDEK